MRWSLRLAHAPRPVKNTQLPLKADKPGGHAGLQPPKGNDFLIAAVDLRFKSKIIPYLVLLSDDQTGKLAKSAG